MEYGNGGEIMTREEAARLLWRVAYDKYGPDDNPMRQREAADIVVTALRGSADKTKEFCMMANQCICCGQEMPEGDQVCGHCRRQHGY
jgi:hypothetical protein